MINKLKYISYLNQIKSNDINPKLEYIYDINEIPNPKPPLHDHCRCAIVIMKAVTAGEATSKGKNGADWWLANYQNLPPYYLIEIVSEGKKNEREQVEVYS